MKNIQLNIDISGFIANYINKHYKDFAYNAICSLSLEDRLTVHSRSVLKHVDRVHLIKLALSDAVLITRVKKYLEESIIKTLRNPSQSFWAEPMREIVCSWAAAQLINDQKFVNEMIKLYDKQTKYSLKVSARKHIAALKELGYTVSKKVNK